MTSLPGFHYDPAAAATLLGGGQLYRRLSEEPSTSIRKASLFARERKRDSEEELLLKMADLGGGRHPVSAVRSKQLTRRAFWADPTIHYLGQVAVESREGSEEPQLTRCALWADPIGGLHLAIPLLPIVARTSDS